MGKNIIKDIEEELSKVEHKFRAMPDVSEYVYQQATRYRSKEAYFDHVFRQLKTRGFIVVKPLTPHLIASIKADIDYQLEEAKET